MAASGAKSSASTTDTARAAAPDVELIRLRGVRVHNLKNIDLDLPRDQMIVITGPSGSGKSSLAFDTLYAEGQRQFVESLSVYAQQFLAQVERPDADLIEGLPPTISIDQQAGSHNPRSTVATVTEIYDHLRLLYARLGEAHCWKCGATIRQQVPEQIQVSLQRLPEGTKLILLAPLVRGRKGQHQEVFAAIRKAGFVRARINGEIVALDELPELSRQKKHTIDAVIDRLVIREGASARLAESIQTALAQGEGVVIAAHPSPDHPGQWVDRLFSTRYACPNCELSFEELEPRTFSFNSPYGACPTCQGLGRLERFDEELVVPDLSLSLGTGAIAPWRHDGPKAAERHRRQLAEFTSAHDFRWNTPLEKLKPRVLKMLLEGDEKSFPGIFGLLEHELTSTKRDALKDRLEACRAPLPCPECGGARLRREARSVKVRDKAISELTALTVDAARQFFKHIAWTPDERPIAQPLVREIVRRLEFLMKVGLDYLTLDRPADTLSGGESQRIRLAAGIGSGLVGVCYILDEPSIGLHPRDNQRLIDALRQLQQQGNTMLVVEHDDAIMRQADLLIDVGPGAGIHGGEIVEQGTPAEVIARGQSTTARYLAGTLKINVPAARRAPHAGQLLTIEGATANNLKDVTAEFPLGTFICVTGPSGSGKSSLLHETLAPAVLRKLGMASPKPGPFTKLRGVQHIDKLVEIDQSPIGRTPRSNPATFTGVFDEVRKVFTTTRESRQRGYKAGRFSFNVPGGRCEDCQGQGMRKIEMTFLPDLYVKCPTCQGARFNRQTLEVGYRDRSIADVLDMQIEAAAAFFENHPAIHHMLVLLEEVGLGYLQLGQACTTLSGGEAQRIKLATELGRAQTGRTLYLLDEPTTGLHFDDVNKLLLVLGRLVDAGNTVIVIEHNLDVMKTADWIIDLGPEGGEAGGQIVATGTPEQIAAAKGNITGKFLRPLLTHSA